MSTPNQPRDLACPRCPRCEHPISYHSGTGCLSAARTSSACTCPLTQKQIEKPRDLAAPSDEVELWEIARKCERAWLDSDGDRPRVEFLLDGLREVRDRAAAAERRRVLEEVRVAWTTEGVSLSELLTEAPMPNEPNICQVAREALKLSADAADGPWFAEEITEDGLTVVDDGKTADDKLFSFACETYEARLIAFSRMALPQLAQEVLDLQAKVDELEGRIANALT